MHLLFFLSFYSFLFVASSIDDDSDSPDNVSLLEDNENDFYQDNFNFISDFDFHDQDDDAMSYDAPDNNVCIF